jgi:hypothetical protein
MDAKWVVTFTLQHGTMGRVARTFTEEAAKRYAETMNRLRTDCRYEASPID